MFAFHNNRYENHNYSLASIGTKLRDSVYPTRRAAEKAMYQYCAEKGLALECIESDKHEKEYMTNSGARFYINRI